MNEEMSQRLHRVLGKFIHDESINPTEVEISFSPTTAVIVMKILPRVPDEDRKLVD
jgi:hypothetical protein